MIDTRTYVLGENHVALLTRLLREAVSNGDPEQADLQNLLNYFTRVPNVPADTRRAVEARFIADLAKRYPGTSWCIEDAQPEDSEPLPDPERR